MLTIAEITAYLEKDSGDAPASPYGTKPAQWGPVAVAAAFTLQGVTGEALTDDSLDHLIGLVVNGHPDPGYLIVAYGAEYGFKAEDYFTADEIETYREE